MADIIADPIFSGLFDPRITSIPQGVSKPASEPVLAAKNLGRWVELPRMPIATAEMGVIECGGRVHVIGGYARGSVNSDFHQVYDPETKDWSFRAPIPFACNHLSLAVIGRRIYSFGGFIELYGVDNTRTLIERALAGELVGKA